MKTEKDCPNCNVSLELVDETFSNYDSERVKKGEKTGNILYCVDCHSHYLENFLNQSKLETYSY